VFTGRGDLPEVVGQFVAVHLPGFFLQHLALADDRIQAGAHLVPDPGAVGRHRVFGFVRFHDLAQLADQFLHGRLVLLRLLGERFHDL
jgi:hypothetical protein